jgi:hypothetical protein
MHWEFRVDTRVCYRGEMGRKRRCWGALVVVLWGTVLACPRNAALTDSVTVPLRYHLNLDSRFDFQAVEGTAASLDVLRAVGARTESLDLLVSIGRMREFRDGSFGELIRFERALRDGKPMALEGRSVELRRFGDGEMLAINPANELVGGVRQGEVYDIVFLLLSPQPRSLKKGETGMRTMRLPLQWSRTDGWTHQFRTQWTYMGATRGKGGEQHLRYTGSSQTAGGANLPTVKVLGDGTVVGEVWYDRVDQGLRRHEVNWSRTVHVEYPDVGVRISQLQEFVGRLERAP